jgi:hypoxanthine phosphoribosyltransferase
MTQTVNWQYIDNACTELTEQITENKEKYDFIYGIPRGGLVIAVIMSHKLNVPIYAEDYVFYAKERILFVDDIADTGTTLESYKKLAIAENAKFATIHKKVNSRFIPDYYYKETDKWIVYPWETVDSSKADYKR